MKKCIECEVEKEEDEFYWQVRDVKRKRTCKKCYLIQRKEYDQTDRGKAIRKEYVKSDECKTSKSNYNKSDKGEISNAKHKNRQAQRDQKKSRGKPPS